MPPKRKASAKTESKKKKAPKTTGAKRGPKTWADLFNKYRDSENSTTMSPEGCELFFKDIGVSLESITPLIIAWKMDAQRMGVITEDEWAKGGAAMSVNTIAALKKKLPALEKEIKNDPDLFQQLYSYCFSYAKSHLQKSMESEIALVLWDLLLANDYTMIKSFIQFVKDESPVKVINKDQWSSLLDFCRTVGDDLDGYDSNSSWPCLFDEYVEWKHKNE